MNVDFSEVLTASGRKMSVEASMSNMKESFCGEEILISVTEPFIIDIECVDKNIIELICKSTVKVVRPCSRCLADVSGEYRLNIRRRIDITANKVYVNDASEPDDISYIEDCNLDVDRLILDELFTLLPMNVLCKEDCKGICKVCGTNLNMSTCECDQTVPDPRMAVFGDLFKQINSTPDLSQDEQ